MDLVSLVFECKLMEEEESRINLQRDGELSIFSDNRKCEKCSLLIIIYLFMKLEFSS